MKKFILIVIIVTVSLSISKDPLRKLSEINIGKIKLDYFLKIHNNGLKELKSLKNNDNSKTNLERYLVNKRFSLDFLKEADLSNANLKGLDFRFLNLKETTLVNSDLTNSNLEETNLKESNLTNANLSGTNLKGANLKEATVTNVNFSNANLAYADIHEAEGLTLKQ